jgi:hypothetical protein
MFATVLNLFNFKRRVRALGTTISLALAGVAVILVAIGFGLSLLYVWLQQIYGTMPALAIIGGGCAGLALILFMTAFLRPASRLKRRNASLSQRIIATGERTIDESIDAVQQGSRETMLVALATVLVAGVTLGRKL